MSHIGDDWQPPPCKHGAPAIITSELVELTFASGAARYLPGPQDFHYECPTPDECKWEFWKQAQS